MERDKEKLSTFKLELARRYVVFGARLETGDALMIISVLTCH